MQLKCLVREVSYICLKPFRAVPWLWQSVAGLSLAETHLSIRPAHVQFVVDEMRTDNPFTQAEFGTAFYYPVSGNGV
jgi:hypothetical protein